MSSTGVHKCWDSVGIGYVMDFSFQSRRTRGLVGIGIVALFGTAIWGGGLASQLNYSHDDPPKRLDFKTSGNDFAGPFVLYFSYGLLDAMFQSMVYWVIGALADDSETLSRYSLTLLKQAFVRDHIVLISFIFLAPCEMQVYRVL